MTTTLERQPATGLIDRETTSLPEANPTDLVTPKREVIHFTEQELTQIAESAINTILPEQHPISGLFPASALDTCVREKAYHKAWLRDNSMVIRVLSDRMVQNIFPQDTKIGDNIRKAANLGIKGYIRLFAQDSWKEKLKQVPERVLDEKTGKWYFAFKKPVVPVITNLDGSECEWYAMNQPDSLGEFLSAVANARQTLSFVPDNSEQEVLDLIALYTVTSRVYESRHATMWEDVEVTNYEQKYGEKINDYPSVSAVAIVANGQRDILPFMSSEIRQTLVESWIKAYEFVMLYYPNDYTVPFDHKSSADLATLIAIYLEAIDGPIGPIDRRVGYELYPKFMQKAKEEGLITNRSSGMKRFKGDSYYRGDEEAYWLMRPSLEAVIYFRAAFEELTDGNFVPGIQLFLKGQDHLSTSVSYEEQFGYQSELVIAYDGILKPNGNKLLMNYAFLTHAAAMGAYVLKNFGNKIK